MAVLEEKAEAAERPPSPAVRPVLVSVIGPPGAGKSTIVAALAQSGSIPVFRLRETIRQRPQLLAGFAPSADPLGWVSLEAVRRVLHTVLAEGRFAFGAATVLLDNFPGTAGQLELLDEIAAVCGARVAVLEVCASVGTVIERVAQRRVCLACGPDSHAPAISLPHDSERCLSCGSVLSRRLTDVPRMHGLRLARYGANLPEITDAAAALGIPHLCINADHDLAEVSQAARYALGQLTSSTPVASLTFQEARS